ncbi:6-phosphofructokinase, putative [Plasmodium gallinaceum]|uniref:6-phosphofructokinase, putative n=1 Tax=Plasmodium gallinaceum TaxID=5849 RepID=A0A1J1GVQ3_PLAGA|nr:6-phosphofructokinase, putative [Plasmodium gallinaceum]CRG96334.1 6-phosphofructokinase, putative [Plasmodium gallinaceum]
MDIENAKKHLSELQEERRKHRITLPGILKNKIIIKEEENNLIEEKEKELLKKNFPNTIEKPIIKLSSENCSLNSSTRKILNETYSTKISTEISTCNYTGNSFLKEMIDIYKCDDILKVGILLTGIQAPGGHNIICGVLDNLKKKNKKNILYGFLNGFEGLKTYNLMELKNEYISMFRNIGGFDMIKSSILNITDEIDKKKCFKICRHLNLNGLIIVGGVDSNSKIALLAEYFENIYKLSDEKMKQIDKMKTEKLSNDTNKGDYQNGIFNHQDNEKEDIEREDITYEIISDLSDEEIKKKFPKQKKKLIKTAIISAPKTVYNELKNEYIECSLGFDTTVFSYCQYISYLMSHMQTYLKGYHFVKIIGNSSSHIALECFLQTRANIVLISEEIKNKRITLKDIINFITDVIKKRYKDYNKKYGIIIIPEGILKKVIEFKMLVNSITQIKKDHIKNNINNLHEVKNILSNYLIKEHYELFLSFPQFFQNQLLMEALSNNNFQYSRLNVEKLLLYFVKKKIEEEKEMNDLEFISHSYGNEITCSLPTNFDCAYSYILGFSCVEIIEKKYNGYICVIKNLKDLLYNVNNIQIFGVPICSLMSIKNNKDKENKDEFSIKRRKVDLYNNYFLKYKKYRSHYLYEDNYRILCGIQYENNFPIEYNDSLYSPKKINGFFINDCVNLNMKQNNVFNQINFTISGLKNEYLELDENKNENKNNFICNYYRSSNNLSEIERTLIKSVIKFNTTLVRHNTRITYINNGFENKLNYNSFLHINKIKEFYMIQENSLNLKQNLRISTYSRNIGVVLLSHCTPGSNNILVGLHQRLSINNFKLIGFIRGLRGLLNNDICIINDNNLKNSTNLGGFPLLGVNLEYNKNDTEKLYIYDLIKEEYVQKIIENCRKNSITNLVFIGDEKVISIMNILNDIFINKKVNIKIITVPISLYNSFDKNLIECSIGYHSMICNISHIVSNLQSNCLNLNKYYYFIKVHTNISSSLILSIQLETHCNICYIGECVANQLTNLSTIIENMSLIIIERINRMKYYGVILFSSNLIYCINDFYELCKDVDDKIKNIEELDELINNVVIPEKYEKILKKESMELLKICTHSVKDKLLKKEKRENEDIDSNFELMLINGIKKYIKELMKKSKENNELYCYKKHMNTVSSQITIKNIKVYSDIDYILHFQTIIKNIDTEINCYFPTHFDNSLAFSHGLLAGIAVENDLVNYVTSIRHLNLNKSNWSSSLYPGFYFINNKDSNGYFNKYPYVAPVPISVKSSLMATIKHNANTWAYSDSYIYVGPVQHSINPDSIGCSHMF